jgi:predicted aspartyl protease
LASFTFSFPDLAATGPILQVNVGPSRALLEALGTTPSRLFAAAALIDTGAQTTVLSPDVPRYLGLRPVGSTPMITPTTLTPVLCDQFHINIYFAPDVFVENLLVAQAPLVGHGFQCLIGRDVLRKGKLEYVGTGNQFTLTL